MDNVTGNDVTISLVKGNPLFHQTPYFDTVIQPTDQGYMHADNNEIHLFTFHTIII